MKATTNLDVFVAFHLLGDDTSDASLLFVRNTVNEYFLNENTQIVQSLNDNGYELIYKIQQPLMSSDKSHSDFFDRLQKLFYKTSMMNPHFTQVDEKSLTNQDEE